MSAVETTLQESTTLPLDLAGTRPNPNMANVGKALTDMGAKLTSMGQSVHLLEASMTPAHARSPSHYVVARTDLVSPGDHQAARNSSMDTGASIIAPPDTSTLRSNYLRANTIAGPSTSTTTATMAPSPLLHPKGTLIGGGVPSISTHMPTGGQDSIVRATGQFHSREPSSQMGNAIQAAVTVRTIPNRNSPTNRGDGSATTPAAQTWIMPNEQQATALRSAVSMHSSPQEPAANRTNSNQIKGSPLLRLQTENKNAILGQLAKLYGQTGTSPQ